jgi:hypothetical protein
VATCQATDPKEGRLIMDEGRRPDCPDCGALGTSTPRGSLSRLVWPAGQPVPTRAISGARHSGRDGVCAALRREARQSTDRPERRAPGWRNARLARPRCRAARCHAHRENTEANARSPRRRRLHFEDHRRAIFRRRGVMSAMLQHAGCSHDLKRKHIRRSLVEWSSYKDLSTSAGRNLAPPTAVSCG